MRALTETAGAVTFTKFLPFMTGSLSKRFGLTAGSPHFCYSCPMSSVFGLHLEHMQLSSGARRWRRRSLCRRLSTLGKMAASPTSHYILNSRRLPRVTLRGTVGARQGTRVYENLNCTRKSSDSPLSKPVLVSAIWVILALYPRQAAPRMVNQPIRPSLCHLKAVGVKVTIQIT